MNEAIEPYIYKIENGEEVAYPNPEYDNYLRSKKYEYFLKRSGIPNFYWNIEFDDYVGNKESNAFKTIKTYAENIRDEKYNHTGLYLYGNSGTQKTCLSCNILKSAMRQGLRTKFILAGHLISKLMKVQSYSVDEEVQREISDFKMMDVICIDDCFDPAKSLLWKGESKNLIISEWDCFLRDLLGNGVKVIMTSNFSPEIVKQSYGDFLYDLIDRNIQAIELNDSVKEVRKLQVNLAFGE